MAIGREVDKGVGQGAALGVIGGGLKTKKPPADEAGGIRVSGQGAPS
jgi:hypothetical protein